LIYFITILLVFISFECFAGWNGTPVNINGSPGAPNVHYNSGNRRLVRVDSTLIALAPESTDKDHTYRSTDNGATWSEIDTDGEYSGVLVRGADNYIYHFYHAEADNTIKMVKLLYNAVSVPAPSNIQTGLSDSAVGAYKMMSATVDSTGKLYAAYCHGSPDSCYITSSSDAGTTWSSPSTIVATAGGVSNFYIKIEADQANNILATWKEFSAGPVYFSKSTNGGTTWSSPVTLAAASSKANLDILPATSSTYYVFAQSEVVPRGCVFTKSTDGGVNWSAWATVEAAQYSGGYADPSAALGDDGTIYVSYRSDASPNDSAEWKEHLAYSSDGGTTWTVVYKYESTPNFDTPEYRVGTRSHIRYQTHYSGGGALDWIWMQGNPYASQLPTYFNTNADVTIATTSATTASITGLTITGGSVQ